MKTMVGILGLMLVSQVANAFEGYCEIDGDGGKFPFKPLTRSPGFTTLYRSGLDHGFVAVYTARAGLSLHLSLSISDNLGNLLVRTEAINQYEELSEPLVATTVIANQKIVCKVTKIYE